jgi:cobalt-zinc-cadmium efflux system protein
MALAYRRPSYRDAPPRLIIGSGSNALVPMAHSHSHAHHDHDHAQAHAGHAHGPANGSLDRAFALGVVLNLGFVVVESIAGWRGNSLALLADAGHNLSDVLSLLLAWGATVLSRRAPSQRHTYGLRRTSILAALANALLLLGAVGAIAWEAVQRFSDPHPVEETLVLAVATLGIIINTGTAMLFLKGRHDVNVRGAFLHMAADAAVSGGVVVAALVQMRTGWLWLDPATSLVIAAVIAASTWGLFRESLDFALDAVPAHIDPVEVADYLRQLPGVSEVHDLHIWGLSTTEIALTAHLVMPEGPADDALLARLNRELLEHFGIHHSTVQVEQGHEAHPCPKQGAV